MIPCPFRRIVRILFHLNVFTKVLSEEGNISDEIPSKFGMVWDIPTDIIPRHLRGIGSRFYYCGVGICPEPHDSAEDLREALSEWVEEIVAANKKTPN